MTSRFAVAARRAALTPTSKLAVAAAAALLALIAIVAQGTNAPAKGDAPAPSADRAPLRLEVAGEHGCILAAAAPSTVHLNVRVTGADVERAIQARAPLNVVFVLDKSGSMNADDKWGYVHEALEQAFRGMGPDDYVALVAYDTNVQVVIPCTRNIDPEWAIAKLASVSPGGSTALYAGLERGAELALEHLDRNHINRVILLSDGRANVGPSQPRDVAALAERYSGRGLRLSTIGVGADYNEDLMLGVAKESGGAYYFIDEPKKIASIFEEELSGLKSVVARDIEIVITLPDGVRFRGSLDKGDQCTVEGQTVRLTIPEVSARQHANVMLELEVPAGAAGKTLDLAQVTASYVDPLRDGARGSIEGAAQVAVVDAPGRVEDSMNEEIAARVIQLKSIATRERAMQLMDAGRKDEALQLYSANAAMLQSVPRKNLMQGGALQAEMANTAKDREAYESGDEMARKQAQFSAYEGKKK